ncbi:MAG: ABC transporter substrate-binding protein [Erysipelotrichaceae bacterium]|nr:ABC transporter substrate-binding protein [Erysipelotrichaceae bacterium]
MKFKFIKKLLLLPFILGILPLGSCSRNENKLTIAEVTHSVFYAPMYVAKNKGYFDEVGLEVDIITTPGADKVMAALLSKDAQIGLMGPEATVYVYQNGQKDYAINFAQLTQKDGSFLLGRDKVDTFSYDILKGKTIIGGRKGGMPEMTLEYVLKKNGLTITQNGENPDADVNIRTDVSFDATTGVFVAGESDFCTAFEPVGTQIEKQGKGYIIASLGELLNEEVPYTCFSSLKSYLNKNEDKLTRFTKAIIKGLDYVNNNKPEDIASYLQKDFSSSSNEELINVINNYKKIKAWPIEMNFTKKSFDKLIDIVKEANELEKDVVVPYEKLVINQIINTAK